MNTCVFSIVNWNTQEEAEKLRPILSEWKSRSDHYLDHPYTFLTLGSDSDLIHKPLDIDCVNLGFGHNPNRPKRINHWKCGLFTGIYRALQLKSQIHWDYLIYDHYCVWQGASLIPYIEEFAKTPYTICAPQELTPWGSVLETGLMIMKPDAAREWLLQSGMHDVYIDNTPISVESEATIIFKDKWFNPFDNITSIKKYHSGIKETSSEFEHGFTLTNKELVNNDFIFATTKHCSEQDIENWKMKHPLI